MQDKQMVGVVVGSNDSQEHQDSVEEGWRVVKMIDDFGVYQACLLEVGGLGSVDIMYYVCLNLSGQITKGGPWLLHYDDTYATFDKEKFSTLIR